MRAANNRQTKRTLLFRLDCLRCAGSRSAWGARGFRLLLLDTAEFFCIGKDKVHMLQHGQLAVCIQGEWYCQRTLSNANICPVICRPSINVIRIR